MVGVTVVVEELTGVVVGIPDVVGMPVVVDTGVVVVVVGSLQLSATKRKITRLSSYSN